MKSIVHLQSGVKRTTSLVANLDVASAAAAATTSQPLCMDGGDTSCEQHGSSSRRASLVATSRTRVRHKRRARRPQSAGAMESESHSTSYQYRPPPLEKSASASHLLSESVSSSGTPRRGSMQSLDDEQRALLMWRTAAQQRLGVVSSSDLIPSQLLEDVLELIDDVHAPRARTASPTLQRWSSTPERLLSTPLTSPAASSTHDTKQTRDTNHTTSNNTADRNYNNDNNIHTNEIEKTTKTEIFPQTRDNSTSNTNTSTLNSNIDQCDANVVDEVILDNNNKNDNNNDNNNNNAIDFQPMIESNDNTLLSTHSPHHNDSVAPPLLSDEPHSDEHESVTITNDFEDPLPRSASKSNVTVDTAFGGVYDHTSSTFEHTAHRHSLSMSRSLTTSRDSSHDDADDDNDEQTTGTPGAVSSPTQHTSNDAVSSTPNYPDDASQHSALSESEHDHASHSDSSTTTATTSRPKVRTRRRSTYQWKHKQQQQQPPQGDEQVHKETIAKKRGRRRSRRLSHHDTVSPHTSALTTAKVRTKVARRRLS